jgi:hypothetical protein
VRADPGTKLIRLGEVVRADRDQTAITHLELTVELKKPFVLPAILGTIAPAAENENHRVRSLELRELPPLPGVVGKLIVGEAGPWNHVRSHGQYPPMERASPVAP